jgi:signal transduction histidine kinase
MGLIRLLRTTAFRSFLIYFALFAITAAIAVAYIYWKTNVLLAAQLESGVRAEVDSLDEQYRSGGLDQLVRTVAERSETPGSSLYLLTDAEGHRLAGTLKAVSPELWNSQGRVAFVYRRPAPGGSEERLAYALVFRLGDGTRLLVGRDIEDRREFGRVVRSAFLWTLGVLALIGLSGGLLIGRGFLRRIESMSETSRQIMAGDLSRRIPISPADDEFDRLAASLNTMLQRITELIDGFKQVSDNIAHDLKTPLTRLRNRVEAALRDRRGETAYREALQATIDEADDIIRTFDALLSIARLEAGASRNVASEFDLGAVIQGVCDLYEPVAEEQGIALTCDATPEARIRGEPQLIAQAVANLLDNAIKYGGEANGQDVQVKPSIAVSVAVNGELAQITVADHGPGIPPADRERALKRFVRLEESRSRPGSGLGLSLAAAVARLHGGSIMLLDNDPGVKAVLTVRRDGSGELAAPK